MGVVGSLIFACWGCWREFGNGMLNRYDYVMHEVKEEKRVL